MELNPYFSGQQIASHPDIINGVKMQPRSIRMISQQNQNYADDCQDNRQKRRQAMGMAGFQNFW